MKIAVWGDAERTSILLPLLLDQNGNPFEKVYYIEDENGSVDFQVISFSEFLRMYHEQLVDGVIVVDKEANLFSRSRVKRLQLNNIRNIGIPKDHHHLAHRENTLYWLASDKTYIPYLEMHVIDSCNLNCQGCAHFANLFTEKDIYDLDMFQDDVEELASKADVITFRIMGGEPLLKDDLLSYCEIVRKYFPKTDLRIVSNGLLVPSMSDELFKKMNEYGITVEISAYPPTRKIKTEIKEKLDFSGIPYRFAQVEEFAKHIQRNGISNPEISSRYCGGQTCWHFREGKIYKCAVDALAFRLQEFSGETLKLGYATGVDIRHPNFSSMMDFMEGPVEMCRYCSEKPVMFSWSNGKKPRIDDWLV